MDKSTERKTGPKYAKGDRVSDRHGRRATVETCGDLITALRVDGIPGLVAEWTRLLKPIQE